MPHLACALTCSMMAASYAPFESYICSANVESSGSSWSGNSRSPVLRYIQYNPKKQKNTKTTCHFRENGVRRANGGVGTTRYACTAAVPRSCSFEHMVALLRLLGKQTRSLPSVPSSLSRDALSSAKTPQRHKPFSSARRHRTLAASTPPRRRSP